ncbi:MAG: hypothetical protein ACXWP5_12155, partial [Bdellovibrionota bacterium]
TTRSVRLKIRVRKNSQNPLHQRFEVDEELVADSDAQLSAKLNDLPINIPAHRVGKRIWELDFTPNILELLAKGSTPSHYSGVLVLDHSGKKNLPLTLVLNQLPAETSSVRSAG